MLFRVKKKTEMLTSFLFAFWKMQKLNYENLNKKIAKTSPINQNWNSNSKSVILK